MLTKTDLDELFSIKDGALIRRKSVSLNTKVGDRAGTLSKDGYIRVFVAGKSYLAHQLIFIMTHGYKAAEIDHINGIKADNRPGNLREVTRSQNRMNTLGRGRAKSKNVHLHSCGNRFEVSITVNSKKKYIGLFDDLELAELVAYEAREKYHGKFANHGALA
jgi:hypothetical protein